MGDKESFSAVLLAVLLSVIISPYALSFTLSYYEKQQQELMDAHLKKYEDTNLHPVYFAINTKARGQWGHQDKILHRIFSLQLKIKDRVKIIRDTLKTVLGDKAVVNIKRWLPGV